MDITELKSGFWGYKKNNVCEYVAEINEQFSKKLMETIKEYDCQIRELQSKIAQLEQENAALQKECGDVTQVFVAAKKFSDELKIRAQKENKELRERNAEYSKEQLNRINALCFNINKIRDSVYSMLTAIDNELQVKESELTAIGAEMRTMNELQEGTETHES